MRVRRLPQSGAVYTANAYLILGDWSKLDDVNALIDPGRDRTVFVGIDMAPTGVGKKRLERVVLTHSHYDHAELLAEIRERYQPDEVGSFHPGVEGLTCLLEDGATLRLGDEDFEVVHTPGHTADSVCFWAKTSGALFSGDTQLFIRSSDGQWLPEFVTAVQRLAAGNVKVIYPGHGDPITENCGAGLRATLRYIGEARR